MPELPEVETIVRDLKKKIIGQKIIRVWSDTPKLVKNFSAIGGSASGGKNFKDFEKEIKGRKIFFVDRKGKNILISLSKGKTLLIHQKMTGHLLVGKWKFIKNIWQPIANDYLKQKVNNYIHLLFYLDNGKMLALSDLRKFAKAVLFDTEKLEELSDVKNLGPDPLDKKLSFSKFKEILKNKKGKIKQVLMNQEIISGIGNIYSDEILFLAQIHPLRKIENLSENELKKIYKFTKRVLVKAIRLRGTSISDFRDTSGVPGSYDKIRLVYQREGELCPKLCKGVIKRIKIGGRSAHFCPACQRLKP